MRLGVRATRSRWGTGSERPISQADKKRLKRLAMENFSNTRYIHIDLASNDGKGLFRRLSPAPSPASRNIRRRSEADKRGGGTVCGGILGQEAVE